MMGLEVSYAKKDLRNGFFSKFWVYRVPKKRKNFRSVNYFQVARWMSEERHDIRWFLDEWTLKSNPT